MRQKPIILNVVEKEEIGRLPGPKEIKARLEIMQQLEEKRNLRLIHPSPSPPRNVTNWEEYHENNRKRQANIPVLIYFPPTKRSPLYNLIYPESMLIKKVKKGIKEIDHNHECAHSDRNKNHNPKSITKNKHKK